MSRKFSPDTSDGAVFHKPSTRKTRNGQKNIGSSKELLTEKEYDAARSSTLNAHYTSPTVIRAMYDVIEKWGFARVMFWNRPAA